MRTTMDSAGRVVIPKEVRQLARIKPGMALEVGLRDGHIEIEPAPAEITIRKRGWLTVAAASGVMPELTLETVEETRLAVRFEE